MTRQSLYAFGYVGLISLLIVATAACTQSTDQSGAEKQPVSETDKQEPAPKPDDQGQGR